MQRFSLVVTNFNYEQYLPECLESLVTQDYDPRLYEVVCVDDGSTDGSWGVIESFRARHAHLSSIRIGNSGLEKACNTGIRMARNDRIVRVDSDDLLAANFLRRMDKAIAAEPGFDFYYCRDYVAYYSEQEQHAKRLPPFDPAEVFSRGDFFATGTVYKRSDLAEVGFFPESVRNCGLENYSVVLALLERGKTGLAVEGTYFKYRRHRSNMSVLQREKITEYGRALLHGYGREYQTNEYHPYGLQL